MAEDEIRVEIDLDAINEMPIETLDKFDAASRGQLTGGELLDLLDGFVVGGIRGRGYKIKHLTLIAQAIAAAVKQGAEGETSAGA